jgi:uncharacterized protein
MYTLTIGNHNIEFPHDPVLVAYRGSHAHGTYVPSEDPNSVDDVDLMGIALPPLEYYFGMKQWEGNDFWVGQYDVVTYSFSKFVRLLTKGNPNCIGVLWTAHEHIFRKNELGAKLLEHRDMFLGKETVVNAFKGYASSQLHKMTHFYSESYYEELADLHQQIVDAGLEGVEHNDLPGDATNARALIAEYNKLKKKLYSGYMGEKRRKLVDKFGYDCKNASHLIRLLTMCVELLETGKLKVYREDDAQRFIDIKQGKWSLDAISELAENLFGQIRDKYDASKLPEKPNYDLISSKITEWLKEYYLENGNESWRYHKTNGKIGRK